MVCDSPVLLIDGQSHVHRFFHAMPSLYNTKQQPTSVILGFMRLVLLLRERWPQSPIVVVFDPRGPVFRNRIDSQYKANRPPMDPELAAQLAPLREVLQLMGVPQYRVADFEADDVIATLALEAQTLGMNTLIVSNDKDLVQLVNDRVWLADDQGEMKLDPQGVIQRYGVKAEQFVDYQALVGDSVDNVPGVAGIGAKTAASLLSSWHSIDHLYEHLAELKPALRLKLEQGYERMLQSRALVRLKNDVPLEYVGYELFESRAQNQEQLWALLDALELNSIKEALTKHKPKETSGPDSSARQYRCVELASDWQQLKKELQSLSGAGIGLWWVSDSHQCVQACALSWETAQAVYVDQSCFASETDCLSEVLSALPDPKVTMQYKQICKWLSQHNLCQQSCEDVGLQAWVWNANIKERDPVKLATVALNAQPMGTANAELMQPESQKWLEACEKADLMLQLYKHFDTLLGAEPSLCALYEQVERATTPAIAQMECNGVRIDSKLLIQQSAELAQRLVELERDIHQESGMPSLNIGSPKQLAVLLFDKLKLPVLHKTATGQPSTDERTLEKMVPDHPIAAKILTWRQLSKLRNTYTDKLVTMVSPQTGRVHSQFHQTGAITGRLSSSDPNFQNIPVRTEEGRRIRSAVIAASEDHVLIAADYSQIELRILAHVCADPQLCEAFRLDQDVHVATAAEIFSLPQEQVSAEQRRSAKAINFGLIYGMSSFGLAESLNISQEQAQLYHDRYFQRYAQVASYMEQTKRFAAEHGYVETIMGRRIPIHGIKAKNKAKVRAAERVAVNAPMQGSAADLNKLALQRLHQHLSAQRSKAMIVLQVHDELVVDTPKDEIEEVSKALHQIMPHVADLKVPLKIHLGYGNNWNEAQQ